MYHGLFGFFVEFLQPVFPIYDKVFGIFFNYFGHRTASLLSVALLAATVALIISSFYIFLVDRDEYNRIREKQKELQEKMKEAQDNDEMEKANKYMQESFSMQKEFMKTSIKPMIGSMVIFFLFVPWILHTHIPIVETEMVEEGVYEGVLEARGYEEPIGNLTVNIGEEDEREYFFNGEQYEIGDRVSEGEDEWIIKESEYDEENDTVNVKFSYRFIKIPVNLPLFGDTLEWLGTFILFQLPFTIIFRKMLGVQ